MTSNPVALAHRPTTQVHGAARPKGEAEAGEWPAPPCSLELPGVGKPQSVSRLPSGGHFRDSGPKEERATALVKGLQCSPRPQCLSVPVCPQQPCGWLSPGCHIHAGQAPQSLLCVLPFSLCPIFMAPLPSPCLGVPFCPWGPMRPVHLLYVLGTRCPSLAPGCWLHLLALREPSGALKHTAIPTPSSGRAVALTEPSGAGDVWEASSRGAWRHRLGQMALDFQGHWSPALTVIMIKWGTVFQRFLVSGTVSGTFHEESHLILTSLFGTGHCFSLPIFPMRH